MTAVTLHGFAPSTYTRTARMAAIEKGVDHTLVPVAYGKPEHLDLHPFGKMPILTHAGVTLYETLAIVAYLDAIGTGPDLIPADPLARSQTLGAVSVAIDYAYRPVVHTAKIGDDFDPDDMAAAQRVFAWLAVGLASGAYLSGATPTVGDLFLLPMVDYHIAQAGRASVVEGRPALAGWLDRMGARASAVDTLVG